MLRTVLVTALMVGALSGWTGYRVGTGMERGRAATLAESASAVARRNAAHEEQRRAAAALRDARADAAGREVALRAQIDALARAPRPGCEWGPDRLRGVNAAVDLYNGAGVPAALPDDAEGTGGR